MSLTPLIDVVFILLIFFMLVSQFVDWRKIELMPQAQHSGAVSDEQTASLHLLNDGSFTLDGETIDGLQTVISRLLLLGKDKAIFLLPEEAVEIQQVVYVVEALNGAGLTNVGLSEVQDDVSP